MSPNDAIEQMMSDNEVVDSEQTNQDLNRRQRTSGRQEHSVRREGAAFYDTLLWRLRAGMDLESQSGYVLGLTSGERRSGVSTVAANLAIRAADHQLQPVLLVDANVRSPKQHRAFRLKGDVGLADVLVRGGNPEELVQKTRYPGLDVLPLGQKDQFDRARVATEAFDQLDKWMRESYSTVILDLPDATDLRHTLLLARKADSIVLVVRAESSRRNDIKKAVAKLQEDGVSIGGVVLNRMRQYAPRWLARRTS